MGDRYSSDVRRPKPDPRSLAIAAVTMAPVVLAALRAVVHHQVPLGDNGLITLRANDVLTSNQPWFGTWTSASLSAGIDFNNPLPLHFEWLSLFVKPFGLAAGSVIGAASLNIAAIGVALRQGWHAAGRRGEVLMALAASGLAWALGSEMLVDVWQPHNLVLPFLAFIASAVALGTGRWRSLPWAVGIGTFVVGTHLSFVYMVVAALAAAAGVAWRRARANTAGSNGVRLSLVWTAVVVVCTWGQAVWEQLTAQGRGNLSRVLHAGGAGAAPIGPRLAVRLVAQVVALPPWWLRGSFDSSIPSRTPFSSDGQLRPGGVVSLLPATLSVIAVLVGLGWMVKRSLRTDDGATRSMRVVTLTLLLTSLITISVMPAGVLGLASHQVRWLWPMAAMVTVVVADAVHRHVGERGALVVRRLPVALLVVMSAANLPSHLSDLGPAVSRAENATVRSLMHQLAATRLPAPTWFDGSTLQFAEPYSGAVLAALLDTGQPVHAADASFARQLGEQRRRRGDEQYSLQVRTGVSATTMGERETLLAAAKSASGTPVAVVLIDNG